MSNPFEIPKRSGDEASHKMWIYTAGGLYPTEIKEAVDQYMASAKNPVILDVGCGPALWSAEIAEYFPSAQVIGLDATSPDERPLPSNFSFKKHDFTTGIPSEFKANSLDIVHCRMVLQHLKDAQAVLDSIVNCLKPGGFLFIVEGSMEGSYDEHKNFVEPFVYDPSISIEENLNNPKKLSWHSGFLRALGLTVRPPTYQPPRVLLQRLKTVKEITTKDCWAPIHWEGENLEHGKELKQVGLINVKRIYGVASFLLPKSNIPAEIANALIERGSQEVSAGKTYLHGSYIVARKSVA